MMFGKLPWFVQINYAPDDGGGSSAPASGASDSGNSSASSAAPTDNASTGGGGSSDGGSSSSSGAASSGDNSSGSAAPAELPDDVFGGFDAPSTEELEEGASPPVPPKVEDKKPAAATAAPPTDPKATPQAPQPPAAPTDPNAKPQATAPEQPGPQTTIPSPAEPGKIGEHMLANLPDLEKHLAQTPEFQLSQEDIDAINEDVVTHIPRLLARTYVRAMAAMNSQLERTLPAMFERREAVLKAKERSEGEFYSRWPQINKAAHGEIVDALARQYRQLNPGATRQQMIEDLGPHVMMRAKINPTAQAAMPNGNGAAAPQVRTPPPSPFVPAVGGSSAPTEAQAPDVWGGLGAETPE